MSRIATVFCAAVAVAAGGYWLTTSTPSNPLVGSAIAQETEIDTSTIVEMTMGAEDAPVEIIEYASYTCPHCANFHNGAFKQLKEDFIDTGKVKFVYREVYFDRFGLWASAVARCEGPDKFFGVTDLLYENQSEWARAGDPAAIADEIRKIGRLAGFDSDKIEACLTDGQKLQTLVAWYQENAERDGIQSTPSFVVNGETVSNMSYDDFKRLIEDELGS